jgi:predicted acylesterase/phospholipase RssA
MKKMLSLDGGGLRGVFSLAVLERIEDILRQRFAEKQPGFVLADYFDFIGGTSTGSIIAAMLSKGMSVRAIRETYESLGPIVFRKKSILQSWRSFYDSEGFAKLLRDIFEESPGKSMTLGSTKLRTLLMLVMRNGSTGSTWPVTNAPGAKYNRRQSHSGPTNLDLPLWQLVRASAAAPVFFPTELVNLHTEQGLPKTFEFIDGGISPYNNPSVAMFLAAILPVYAVNFPKGQENLFLCSVGTGARTQLFEPGSLGAINLIGGALRSLRALMDAMAEEQDKLCRVLGHCVHGHPIDSEIGDLSGAGMGLFGYCRYQHEFTVEETDACRKETGSKNPFALDDVRGVQFMLKTGRAYAARAVDPEHLP